MTTRVRQTVASIRGSFSSIRWTVQFGPRLEAVEGVVRRLHHTIVVSQDAMRADEEIVAAGDAEVEDGLDAVGLDRPDLGDPADRPEPVAGLQVARHDPALAGLPEPVDAGGDDRLF